MPAGHRAGQLGPEKSSIGSETKPVLCVFSVTQPEHEVAETSRPQGHRGSESGSPQPRVSGNSSERSLAGMERSAYAEIPRQCPVKSSSLKFLVPRCVRVPEVPVAGRTVQAG
jgi:hypothetical protein